MFLLTVEDPRSNDAWKSLLWHIVAHIRIMETEFNEVVNYNDEKLIEQDADEFDESNEEIDFDEENDDMDF